MSRVKLKVEKNYSPDLAFLVLVRLNRALTSNALQVNNALEIVLKSSEVKENIPSKKIAEVIKAIKNGLPFHEVAATLGVFSTYQLALFEAANQYGMDYCDLIGGLAEDIAFEKDYFD